MYFRLFAAVRIPEPDSGKEFQYGSHYFVHCSAARIGLCHVPASVAYAHQLHHALLLGAISCFAKPEVFVDVAFMICRELST